MPVNEEMTPGVMNALMKNKKRDVCACGFPMPVYPGRYPSKCPVCGTDRASLPKPDTPERDAESAE